MPVPRAMTSPRGSRPCAWRSSFIELGPWVMVGFAPLPYPAPHYPLPLQNSRPKGQWVLDAGQSRIGLRRHCQRPRMSRNPPHEVFDFHQTGPASSA